MYRFGNCYNPILRGKLRLVEKIFRAAIFDRLRRILDGASPASDDTDMEEPIVVARRTAAAVRSLPVSRRGLFEVALIGSVYLVYVAIRGAASARETEAMERGIDVVRLSQWLRIYHEEALQDVLLNWRPIIDLLNVMYFVGHFPPLLVFAFWIYRTDRRKYTLVRTTFLLSAAIGLAIYWAIPTAPPRLLPESYGYVDTLRAYGPFDVYNAQQSDPFVNDYAAIPSLHFGWAALLAVGFAWAVAWRWWGIAAAIGWPLATLVIIEGTANHFLLDAVAGLLVVALAFAVAWWLRKRFDGRLDPLL